MCFVLHSTPYQESSLIIDALTADYGRISFVANGARNIKNSLKSKLQLFVPLKISFLGKAGSLRRLKYCEIVGIPFSFLPPVIFSALYVNELTALLYKVEDISHVIFSSYMNTLSSLFNGENPEIVLRIYELSLLSELGYGINLSTDIDTNKPIKKHTWYSYKSNQGFSEVKATVADEKLLVNNIFNGSDIVSIYNNEWNSLKTIKVAKTLCRMSLQPLLNNRKLKSRELYMDYIAIGK